MIDETQMGAELRFLDAWYEHRRVAAGAATMDYVLISRVLWESMISDLAPSAARVRRTKLGAIVYWSTHGW